MLNNYTEHIILLKKILFQNYLEAKFQNVPNCENLFRLLKMRYRFYNLCIPDADRRRNPLCTCSCSPREC